MFIEYEEIQKRKLENSSNLFDLYNYKSRIADNIKNEVRNE